MKKLLVLIGLSIMVMACTGKKDDASVAQQTNDFETEDPMDSLETVANDTLQLYEEKEIPKSADLLFDDFFFSFVTDRKFQSQRVSFPLKGTDAGANVSMTREQWTHQNEFSRPFYSVIYEREGDMAIQKDTSLNSVSIEWIYLNDNRTDRFHFQRVDGTWVLADFDKDVTTPSSNSDFLKFYAQFIADSVFQRESLADHLKLKSAWGGDGDGESEIDLTADDWFEFRKEMPMPEGVMTNINYGQPSLSENRKILLVEGMSSELYVKYKFDRLDGKWRLIEIEN